MLTDCIKHITTLSDIVLLLDYATVRCQCIKKEDLNSKALTEHSTFLSTHYNHLMHNAVFLISCLPPQSNFSRHSLIITEKILKLVIITRSLSIEFGGRAMVLSSLLHQVNVQARTALLSLSSLFC